MKDEKECKIRDNKNDRESVWAKDEGKVILLKMQ